MPVAIALRSFQHGTKSYRKGDPVDHDLITLKALARSGLVSKDFDMGNEIPDRSNTPVPPPPAPAEPTKSARRKGGKKSSASPAAPASQAPMLPPLLPGVPPPLPDVQ